MTSTLPENKQFTKKFYVGVALILLSLIIGKITQVAFMIYFKDDFIRTISVIFYVISWIPLIIGVAWAGKETFSRYNRFFTFKYYKEIIKSDND